MTTIRDIIAALNKYDLETEVVGECHNHGRPELTKLCSIRNNEDGSITLNQLDGIPNNDTIECFVAESKHSFITHYKTLL